MKEKERRNIVKIIKKRNAGKDVDDFSISEKDIESFMEKFEKTFSDKKYYI